MVTSGMLCQGLGATRFGDRGMAPLGPWALLLDAAGGCDQGLVKVGRSSSPQTPDGGMYVCFILRHEVGLRTMMSGNVVTSSIASA
jgi:hypothetical protein